MRALVAIALVSAPAVLFAQGLRDFARGVEIRTDGPGSIFRIVLPDDVYATVTRPDLSDLRVLNAAGDRVPHTLRQAPLPPATTVAPVDVHVFPLLAEAAAGRCKAVFIFGSLVSDGVRAGGTYGPTWIILVASGRFGDGGIYETARLGIHRVDASARDFVEATILTRKRAG